jgi:hypothetical protein
MGDLFSSPTARLQKHALKLESVKRSCEIREQMLLEDAEELEAEAMSSAKDKAGFKRLMQKAARKQQQASQCHNMIMTFDNVISRIQDAVMMNAFDDEMLEIHNTLNNLGISETDGMIRNIDQVYEKLCRFDSSVQIISNKLSDQQTITTNPEIDQKYAKLIAEEELALRLELPLIPDISDLHTRVEAIKRDN